MDEYIIKRKPYVDSEKDVDHSSKRNHIEVNLDELPADPGLRVKISDYNPNIRDEIRRTYLLKGPCQPRNHDFPYTNFGNKPRRFIPAWFDEFSNWLEYENRGDQASGDSFVGLGLSNWAKKEILRIHVGTVNSAHNQAWGKCEALLNKKQHIETVVAKHSVKSKIDYKIRLGASIDYIRFLLRQGLAFSGHGESGTSKNRGKFLELLQFLADHNDSIKSVTFKNDPENLKLTSPDIQKDIVKVAATETRRRIVNGFCDDVFAILIDESRDVSTKEQMSIVVRYVDVRGHIIEHFLGVEHVMNTTSISLKATLDGLFSRHGLSFSKLRRQGYDGASNMQGEIIGLKTLILKENKSAYYVHCFAHQLQLTLVAVAKKDLQTTGLFCLLNNVANVVGGSCKHRDLLREQQVAEVIEGLSLGKISRGRGLNQDTTLVKAGDTRWGSHYDTLVSIMTLFSSVVDVLEVIEEDGLTQEQKYGARELSKSLQTFDFIFCLHFMKIILGITNELSQALQRKEHDIVNAMNLVRVCKHRLQYMRINGWDSLLEQVNLFYVTHDVDVLNMDEMFLLPGRSRRKALQKTNLHYYCVELFCVVIDLQLMELENRFSETTTELLLSMECLNPRDSFSAFDKNKLLHLARLYPNDFSEMDLLKMVETKRHKVFYLVYLLIKLALTLPVATATVERTFSAMKIVKNRLRNKMGDTWMNNCMVAYIEKDIFAEVDNEVIIDTFQKMRTRRGHC